MPPKARKEKDVASTQSKQQPRDGNGVVLRRELTPEVVVEGGDATVTTRHGRRRQQSNGDGASDNRKEEVAIVAQSRAPEAVARRSGKSLTRQTTEAGGAEGRVGGVLVEKDRRDVRAGVAPQVCKVLTRGWQKAEFHGARMTRREGGEAGKSTGRPKAIAVAGVILMRKGGSIVPERDKRSVSLVGGEGPANKGGAALRNVAGKGGVIEGGNQLFAV